MAPNEEIKKRTRHRVLQGVNLALYTVIGLAIVVLINWFVNRHNHRWDLTPNAEYSLSPQTKKLLQDLKQNVTIYAFDHKEGFTQRRDLLGNYEAASNHLTVQYVDPDRQPALAKQFDVRSYGTIVVASGTRHFQAQNTNEEGVTNALIRVLKGERTVCFIQGHGERDLDSTDRSGFQKIKAELGNENYKVNTLVLLQSNEIPVNCGMIIIAGPQHDYLPPEVDTVQKYVDGGGRALVMLDPGVKLPNLQKMLADWGINVRNDLVVDMNPVAQLFGTTPDMPLIIQYGSNPIVEPMKRIATLFPLTRSIEISKDVKGGSAPDMLCQTSGDSFGVEGFNPKMQKVSYQPGKDIKGPLTVAVAGTVSSPDSSDGNGSASKAPQGRVVAVGTSLLAANAYLGFQGNQDLVMNMVNWLSAEEDLISIRPKAAEHQHLDMNQRQMGRLLYLGVFGLPLVIVLIGAAVWWERRR